MLNFTKHALIFIAAIFSIFASAQTVVPVYWPFSLASTHATMVRVIADELNKNQKEYTFVFVHKPGAGGSIAANTLLNHQGPALMAATSSFFIRPNLYPEASHDLAKFRTFGSYCDNQPLALFSSKYKNLNEIKNLSLSIGVIPGSITHITAVAYEKSRTSNLNKVFYQGTPEITRDVIAGHIDLGIDFLSAASQFGGKANILAISGVKNYKEGVTFKSQSIEGVESTHANFLIYAQGTDTRLIDLTRQVLVKVLESNVLHETCQQEYGTPVKKVLSVSEANDLYKNQVELWRKQTQNVTIEK